MDGKKSLEICVARNGYLVNETTPISQVSAYEPWVFETFESMVNWLQENLTAPRDNE